MLKRILLRTLSFSLLKSGIDNMASITPANTVFPNKPRGVCRFPNPYHAAMNATLNAIAIKLVRNK